LKPSSLQTRILLTAVGIVLVATLVNILASSYVLTRSQTESQLQWAHAIARVLSGQLERILFLGIPIDDLQGFERQCAEVVERNTDLAYAYVVSTSGHMLFHNTQVESAPPGEIPAVVLTAIRDGVATVRNLDDDSHAVIEQVLDPRSVVVAYVVVGFANAVIERERASLLAVTIGVDVLVYVISVMLLIFALSRFVLMPIANLVHHLERMRPTELAAAERLPESGSAEFGVVSRAFNRLLDRLGEHELELREAKTLLEARVAERTRALRDQVAAKEQALAELAAAQNELVALSRNAGMAEVATGVLHNVGNVLNSVNVSSNMLIGQLRESRVGNVARVAEMLADPQGGLARFLTEDPRGQQIPAYLASLAEALEEERGLLLTETQALNERIDHIKEIVAMQQSYGRVIGVLETLPPEQLMEDALKLKAESLSRDDITVRREYAAVPPITVDKHKVLQILLNLISNARYASTLAPDAGRAITLRIASPEPNRLRMQVVDQGIGISPENLTQVFQHGFTTRRDGHGFGLHSGALAAKEMGGSLTAESHGLGLGATFTLELPLQPEGRA